MDVIDSYEHRTVSARVLHEIPETEGDGPGIGRFLTTEPPQQRHLE